MMTEYRKHVWDYMSDFTNALTEQLKDDDKRYGDTWKKRPRGDYNGTGDEVDRTMQRLRDYYDQYKNGGVPFPWLKAIGNLFICWIREQEAKNGNS